MCPENQCHFFYSSVDHFQTASESVWGVCWLVWFFLVVSSSGGQCLKDRCCSQSRLVVCHLQWDWCHLEKVSRQMMWGLMWSSRPCSQMHLWFPKGLEAETWHAPWPQKVWVPGLRMPSSVPGHRFGCCLSHLLGPSGREATVLIPQQEKGSTSRNLF